MKSIVVGVDGSEHALRAVDTAAKLALGTGAALVLVTASVLPFILDEELEAYGRVEHVRKEELRRLLVDPRPPCLDVARERAVAAGVKDVQTVVAQGDPAEEIVAVANKAAAGLIIVGRRGTGRIADLVFGSVSQKTVRLASCPVMVVP